MNFHVLKRPICRYLAITLIVSVFATDLFAEATVTNGGTATFTVTASGSTPLAYQWYKGTNPIANVQGATLTDWIDPDTGHRVIQLSTEPGSESLYFNLNPFTPDGKKMVITTSNGIALIDLQTRAVERIIEGRAHIIMVGHKTGKIYYAERKIEDGKTNQWICSFDPATKQRQDILKLARGQQVSTVNADETMLGGTFLERTDWGTNEFFDGGPNRRNDIATVDAYRERKGTMMEERLAKHYPMELFFYNIATGETKRCNRCTDWLGHLQFSPSDPSLMMFCHEGPWHKVDRIWTIHTDGTGLKLIHQRTQIMEIAGHEFFSTDGKTIWYDLQTPRGEDFWVAGYELATGKRTWYHLQRDEWGVHFNVSPDGTLFSSDGGDDKMVAHADNGKWMYLLRPELIEDRSAGNIDNSNLIQPGVFRSERLVNMARHDYALEPNGMFSPDMKWLIFRSNMSGANQVYAVELSKPGAAPISPAKANTEFH
jgi:oligogalacturonide lyase